MTAARKPPRGRVAGIAGILLLGAALVWALRPRPVGVEVATATRGPLTATVTADGRSRVKDLYVLAAPVDGSLERIVAEAGDSVPGGSVVARLVPLTPRPLDARTRAEAIAAVSSARASVARAEATQKEAEGALAHAESELATARKLAGEGAAARNSVVHGEHDVEVRLQAVAAARSAVQASRFDLTRAEALVAPTANRFAGPPTLVRSPVAGRLLRVLREDAGPLIAGTPLVEIGNIATLEFVADLLTTDAMTVRAGAAAMIRDWGGKPELAARVRRVEPGAFTKVSALGLEEQRVRVVLDPTAAPPVGFGNDFHVSVSIVTWNGPDVLAVPSSALFRSGADWAVFVMRDGRARLARVTPGPSDGERTVIESGLSEGESVIVQPSDLLRDGTRVKALRKR